MYLHLGQDVAVLQKEILGIFDLDNTSSSAITRAYLETAQKDRRLISVGDELPRSFIVCENQRGRTVYLSQLSTGTLLKRSETRHFEKQQEAAAG